MYIIECLPLTKGLNKDSLSYFSKDFLEPGSLIKVNIRNKSNNALVLESRDAVEVKSEIKSADYQLKKISSFSTKPFLQKEFLEAVKKTAQYFVASEGGVLAQLLPKVLLENPSLLSKIPRGGLEENSLRPPLRNIEILQAPDDERFMHYRSLIREQFAKKKSVFICMPQNEGIKLAKEKLEKGIESFVCVIHNEMNIKELREEWKKINLTKHPLVVISTARWLFLPRDDFGTIVIERENDNGWKTLARPFIDLRFFAETLATSKNIRLIIGDSFLKTETLHRYKQGEIGEFENIKWRLPSEVETKIVDLKNTTKKEKEFKTISNELGNLIKETVDKGSSIFLFASRKGLSSVTLCRDCGEQVKCNNCSSFMVLYKTKEGGAFRCHQCGETRNAAEVCQKCRSWRLAAYGAGIDRVAEEITKNMSKLHLFEIHKDVASTSIKAQNIVKDFYENKGSILLSTEMAFPYLHKKIAVSAIVSFDSLFSIPDFRIREKIFHLILQTRSLAKEKFLIQSHNPEDGTIKFATLGNLADFYKQEIEDRQTLNYPPFSIFIKVTVRGTRSFVSKETEFLKNIFSNPKDPLPYKPAIFPSTHEKHGEQSAMNAVIKIPKNLWPDLSIIHILKSFPPHFEIKIDPDNLL